MLEQRTNNMRMKNVLLILLVSSTTTMAASQTTIQGTVFVNASSTIAQTEKNFICATIDWWPKEKCNYKHCPWGSSSVMNLDLNHPLLAKAIKAFNGVRIRIGGSLQDQVVYDVENASSCEPFRVKKDGLFGFSEGCLSMKRWDELNRFFNTTGVIVTFGLNALYQRHERSSKSWEGRWNSTNAYDFIMYTHSKGYAIDSWEFGNELSGDGVEAKIKAELYAKDVIELKRIVDEVYRNEDRSPFIAAPGGFFNEGWYTKLLKESGAGTVNLVTHHIYNLGPGNDPYLVSKILDPKYLSKIESTYSRVEKTIKTNGPWASSCVSESGGAYNSGGEYVSDTFVNSFWYLDQLGMASKYDTKVYCRQSLVGGYYGLLNATTFHPNPDYYSALMWRRLMGEGVLSVEHDTSPNLRCYAHCSRGRSGVTLLLINLSKEQKFELNVARRVNSGLQKLEIRNDGRRSVCEGALWREEYHLTGEAGDLRSGTVLLNGVPLTLTGGDIPPLNPVLVSDGSPLAISALSLAFVVYPNFEIPACFQS